MVLDHEVCRVLGCALHTGRVKKTSITSRNDQIRDDWESGDWTLEELSSFWGMKPLAIAHIVRKVDNPSAGTPPLEVAHSC